MARLLHVCASPRGAQSHSLHCARALLTQWQTSVGDLHIVERDVSALAHPDAHFVAASLRAPALRNTTDHAALALSEQLLEELDSADVLLISTPMYNFSLPSGLKAWVDYIVRPQRSFVSTPQGKHGLLKDRPVRLLMAAGGPLESGLQQDFLSPYLRYVLHTIGLTQMEVLQLPNMQREPEKIAASLDQAADWIAQQGASLRQILAQAEV